MLASPRSLSFLSTPVPPLLLLLFSLPRLFCNPLGPCPGGHNSRTHLGELELNIGHDRPRRFLPPSIFFLSSNEFFHSCNFTFEKLDSRDTQNNLTLLKVLICDDMHLRPNKAKKKVSGSISQVTPVHNNSLQFTSHFTF